MQSEGRLLRMQNEVRPRRMQNEVRPRRMQSRHSVNRFVDIVSIIHIKKCLCCSRLLFFFGRLQHPFVGHAPMHALVLGLLLGVSLILQYLTWRQVEHENDSITESRLGPHTLSHVRFASRTNTSSKNTAARSLVYPVVTKQLTQIPITDDWLWFNGQEPQVNYMQVFPNNLVTGKSLRMVLKKAKTDETITDMSVPATVVQLTKTRRHHYFVHTWHEYAIVVQLPVLPPFSGVGLPPNNTYQPLDLYLSMDSGTMELHSIATSHDPLAYL
jgi:hypothetical protein